MNEMGAVVCTGVGMMECDSDECAGCWWYGYGGE